MSENFDATDFDIPVRSGRSQVKVRVIDMVTDYLTTEVVTDIPVSEGLAQLETSNDVLKVAAIERTHQPGKIFVGFIRGIGLKHGALANTNAAD